MARWLIDKGVRSVAMQSTGVYWMPVFEVLEQHGLEVFLVNAQHTKNVPGRKSDVEECQWLLKLHAFGLLNKSFQPSDEIRVARTLWRHRGDLVAEAGSAVQRMQKVLTEMNVQLSNVLSDLSGVSGMNIIQAILEGEHPQVLAAMVMPGVKATPEDIAKSLEGNWREELLFVLRQQLELHRIYQEKVTDCDLQLRKHLESLGSKVDPKKVDPKKQTLGPNVGSACRSSIIFRTVTGVLEILDFQSASSRLPDFLAEVAAEGKRLVGAITEPRPAPCFVPGSSDADSSLPLDVVLGCASGVLFTGIFAKKAGC